MDVNIKPTPGSWGGLWMVSFVPPWVHGGCSNPRDGGGEGEGEERHPGASPGHRDRTDPPPMASPSREYTWTTAAVGWLPVSGVKPGSG